MRKPILVPSLLLPPVISLPEVVSTFPATVASLGVRGKVGVLAGPVSTTLRTKYAVTVLSNAIATTRVGSVWVVTTFATINVVFGGVAHGEVLDFTSALF